MNKGRREKPGATPRQKVISEIMSGVEPTRIDTDRNLLDVLDRVHEITAENVDTTHVFKRKEIEARGYDLKAVNPNAKREEDLRT